jgi:Ca2+-binding RTX toxin-like protein
LVVPTLPAGAAVTCTFAGGTVTVTLGTGDDGVEIRRAFPGNEIHVSLLGGSPVTCTGGPPMIDTTDTIDVNDTSSGGSTDILLQLGSPFAPGATNETGSSDEIEFNISLSDGSNDRLFLVGGHANHWVLGDAGINVNADETDGVDADITYPGVDALFANGGGGADVIDGSGDSVTGGDLNIAIQVASGDGDDTVAGGSGDDLMRPDGALTTDANDSVDGGSGRDAIDYMFFEDHAVTVNLAAGTVSGAGNDDLASIEDAFGTNRRHQKDILIGNAAQNLLRGMGGNDTLAGGAGEDFLKGGAGQDTIDAQSVATNIDLVAGTSTSSLGPDHLLGIENAVGGPRSDRLLGTAQRNRLSGGGGRDDIRGRGVADLLNGGLANDTLQGGAGNDLLNGGPDVDLCKGGPGRDTRRRCERGRD